MIHLIRHRRQQLGLTLRVVRDLLQMPVDRVERRAEPNEKHEVCHERDEREQVAHACEDITAPELRPRVGR
jgi:hypothetical protein